MSLIRIGDDERGPRGPVLAPICAKAGPLSPRHCKVVPPGIAKATAGIAFKVDLQCFDADDRKIYEGGARVRVRAVREDEGVDASQAASRGAEMTEGSVEDNNDGTYTITLSCSEGGDYKVAIEVNSVQVQGSPFALTVISLSHLPKPKKAEDAGGQKPAERSHLQPTYKNVVYGSEELAQVVNVSNISPQVTIEEVRSIMSMCGQVLDCSYVGGTVQYALVRFAERAEAEKAALSINGMQLGDRRIGVSLAIPSVAQGGAQQPQPASKLGEALVSQAIATLKTRIAPGATTTGAAGAAQDPLAVAKARAAAISARILGPGVHQ
ncbi:RRM domain-containing protein [Chloropicon primus]|uniref:RRM domain-containing protein n=1 Tax=Chloropicon primus TaxID=1764295 RepID=A0A5B8MH39_9CHLO|nr:hypothetical protein A3770_03p25360 [Chloropicon primus]UPQ99229.1 RRM domain-containing protein [Chloropicon primus]|mmetsp:Transcript_10578/g.29887  ORF Transcript_10578/g.29887 Transcript_10578/m.29887 type:complete len:324 (+) Transcript_10578:202-1173(+)|eukprot:QDZ20018.1 hypothetical protein A3770_03p25360 [Chloropicon primus]